MSGALDFSRLVGSEPAERPEPTTPIAAAAPARIFTPTPQQQAFIDALTQTARNITLEALAGTGKTSSILMGVDAYLAAFPSHELLVCAYNKSIQLEVDAKLKSRGYDWRQVGCQTVHSMGMSLLRYIYRPEIDEHKIRKLIIARRDTEPRTSPYWAYGPQISSLVSMGKQAAVGFFDELPIGDRSVWYELADHYDIDFDGTADIDAVVTCAQAVYRQSLDITDVIDFDDMVLLPLIKSIRVKYTKDLILGDESQDWSRARQALVRMFMRPRTGRLVVVGDRNQAIFAFSGADSEAMDRLTNEMNALTLPLSVTWRCPKAVVKLAQTIVPALEAAPNAPEGRIIRQAGLTARAEHAHDFTPDYEYDASGSWLTCEHCGCLPSEASRPCDRGTATPGMVYLDDLDPAPGRDAILCRNNAPLIPLAYALIRLGIPAKVEGRKIGEGLQSLVNRWQVKSTADLLRRLDDYRAREVQKHTAKGDEARAQEAEDRVDTLREIIREVNRRGKHDIPSVIEFIDRLFADGTGGESKPCVTLATYHKSKGREWERVILIEHHSRCPSRAARQEWQKEQEAHLAYVSFTRAKDTLVFAG